MAHYFETTLEWYVNNEDEKMLGSYTASSVNLAKILKEEKKKDKRNNFLDIFQVRITNLLLERFPNTQRIIVDINCRIYQKNPSK